MREHLRLDVDDTTLREALTEANPPALLAALVHLTGDPDLLRDDLRPQAGHLREPEAGFTAEQLAELRTLAFEVLSSYRGEGRDLPAAPDEATITRTMNFCTGESIPQEYVRPEFYRLNFDFNPSMLTLFFSRIYSFKPSAPFLSAHSK